MARTSRSGDWTGRSARPGWLETRLDQAFAESPLPEDRDLKAASDLLVRLRLKERLTEPRAV